MNPTEKELRDLRRKRLNPFPYRIVDRATGVRGAYCIEQKMEDAPAYSVYWNPSGWAGSGYVFTDKALAETVVSLLEARRQLETTLEAALAAANG